MLNHDGVGHNINNIDSIYSLGNTKLVSHHAQWYCVYKCIMSHVRRYLDTMFPSLLNCNFLDRMERPEYLTRGYHLHACFQEVLEVAHTEIPLRNEMCNLSSKSYTFIEASLLCTIQ